MASVKLREGERERENENEKEIMRTALCCFGSMFEREKKVFVKLIF
jgi:hypothetical protein